MAGHLKRLILPFLVLTIIFTFYSPVFTKGLLPIPADIITGMYYPWLNYRPTNLPNGIPVKNPLPSDIVSLTYPLRQLSIDLLKNGHWPLWNPYILSGTPLLANFQSAALYPLNLLYLLSNNFGRVWSLQVILQPFLALVFTYLFLRHHRLSSVSSLLAALSWAFCGFFSIWGQYNTVVHAIVYLPLSLLFLDLLASSRLWGVALAFTIAISLFAGNPPMTLILLFCLGIYAIVRYRLHYPSYLPMIFFCLAGLLISAPLLFPGLELSHNSVRQSDQIAVDNHIKYLSVSSLVTLIAPDFYGNPSTLNYWHPGLYDNLTIFIGTVPFLFFLLSFRFKPKNKPPLLVFSHLLAGISLILMLSNPISRLVGNLPLLGLSAMVMTRFDILFSFSVSLALAVTLDHFLKTSLPVSKLVMPGLIHASLLLTPLTITFLIYLIFKYAHLLLPYFPSQAQESLHLVSQMQVSIRNSFLPLIFFLLTVFLVSLYSRFAKLLPKNLAKVIFISALFLLTFYDLFRFFRKYNTFTTPDYLYPTTPAIDYLAQKSNRFWRENAEILPSNTWLPYRLSSASGYDTLHSKLYNGFITLLNGGSLASPGGRYLEVTKPQSPLVNFLGISHFIAIKRNKDGLPAADGSFPHHLQLPDYPITFSEGPVSVVANPHAYPLFYSVTNSLFSPDPETTQKLLLNSNLADTVILNQPPAKSDLTLAKINSLKYDRQQYSFSSSSQKASLISSSIPYNSGWQLFVDNHLYPYLRSNHAFIAFYLPAGDHQVTLKYQPGSFYNGLKVSVLTIIILLSFGVITTISSLQHRHAN